MSLTETVCTSVDFSYVIPYRIQWQAFVYGDDSSGSTKAENSLVGFQVLTVTSMKTAVFYDASVCSLIDTG
jgi:hypothetical protein